MEKIMHRFIIADVFTDEPFSGNQLGVFPEAQGLSDRAMQAIARELNFAETTFVLPPRDPRHTCRVRIFTPKNEMQFAGHPTVGTAAVLAHLGKAEGRIILEEGIGPVPVDLERRGAHIHAQFTIEKPIETPGERPEKSAAAAALSLPEAAVLETWFASGGVRFAFVRLADKAAVDRAQLDRAAWTKQFKNAWSSQLYFFAGEKPVHARMFAPALGIEEDPATGSAAVALAGVLAARLPAADGIFTWRIDQGIAMGRPSKLEASAEKRGGRVLRMKVGGATVLSAEGAMNVPAGY
jgi:trans-2,3-dihydro-3-hydroxyanthranilate isomerase